MHVNFNPVCRCRRRVEVVDRENSMKTVELKVSFADVEGERERVKAEADAKQSKEDDDSDEWDEWGKKPKEYKDERRRQKQRRRSLQSESQRMMGLGFERSAREKLWAQEQKVIAAHHARNERIARAEAREADERIATILDSKAPWTCDVCQKSNPRSKVIGAAAAWHLSRSLRLRITRVLLPHGTCAWDGAGGLHGVHTRKAPRRAGREAKGQSEYSHSLSRGRCYHKEDQQLHSKSLG